MLLWHELKSHDYDCDDGLCNFGRAKFNFFEFFRDSKCATWLRLEKWLNWQWNHRASHDVVSASNFIFKYIEKVLQNGATTKSTFFQPKSQAADAKSKWAKIETGLSLGNRWEMFVSGSRWGETRRNGSALKVFLAHWVSLLHQFKEKTIYEFLIIIIVHPISCLAAFFFALAPSLLINIIGSVLCKASYDRKLCIKTPRNKYA